VMSLHGVVKWILSAPALAGQTRWLSGSSCPARRVSEKCVSPFLRFPFAGALAVACVGNNSMALGAFAIAEHIHCVRMQ